MKEYSSILGPARVPHLPCIAFEKLDGSNLRFEWHRKRGWNKFGTRRTLFDKSDPDFGIAIDMFLNKYADRIRDVVKFEKELRGAEEIVAFCEFLGPNSFAGQHDINDVKDLVLFDVNIHKKGLISPRDFVNLFGHLDIPKVVYEGNLNPSFVNDVRQGKYPVNEGVVCKGGSGHKLWMRKVKTLAYLDRLKGVYAADWEEFWE